MTGILTTWSLLAPQRKVVAVLAAIALLSAFVWLAKLATSPSMALLYSGLDTSTSGEIVAALEQQSVAYEIRGDSIYVDASQRDRARLSLASEGLPSNGIAGYELLDSLSGFGTTSQMFDAAYWRAKEGELARTILASTSISMARVHIANSVQQPFAKRAEPSASVTVTSKNGSLDVGQAEAIRHLVAAAVPDLLTENVTIIDSDYGVILQSGENNANIGSLDPRTEELRAKVERLLSARVGVGNAIVEVMIEARNESETVTERLIDPESSVPISSDSETSTENSSGGNGGAVTVASNLPDNAGAEGNQSSRNKSLSRERVNYEISETVRERVLLPGDIERLSVAVLVNYKKSNENLSFEPRSDTEIAALEQLVKSAVGYSELRGDVVTIESMQFPMPLEVGSVATSGILSGYLFDVPSLIQMAVLALVTLALGLFVVRPILRNPEPNLMQLHADQPNALSLDQVSQNQSQTADLNEYPAAIPETKDPIEILRDTIAIRSEESGHLLRNWIEQDKQIEKEQVT